MKHFNLTISGKVQGVWYRGSTKQRAQELGLKGFVRNEPNGDVYAEVEGEEAILNEFIQWCKKGPPIAQVRKVVIEEGALENFDNFEIHR